MEKEHISEVIVTRDGELIASITADDVIVMDGYEVVCVPSDKD